MFACSYYYAHKFCFLCRLNVLRVMRLLSGDIELYPGPTEDETGKQYSELLELVKSVHKKMNAKHDKVMASLNELKDAQASLEQKIADIDSKLPVVEYDSQSRGGAEGNEGEGVTATTKRLDELQDHSRRENLILHGIPDNLFETRAQSEKEIAPLSTQLWT